MAMMAASRPAYLDRMFADETQRQHRSQPTSPSLRSTNSSISFTSAAPFDLRAIQSNPRPLSPAFEEEASSNNNDDRLSVRSLRLHLSPRRNKLKALLNRRTYPQIQETSSSFDADEMIDDDAPASGTRRRPSLPKLYTSFTSPASHQQQSTHRRQRSKPLPTPPPPPAAQELNCGRCYYFNARNCNGYVMGGSHGDACDNCAAAGFFGAP